MTKGTLITFGGIGGRKFSAGLETIGARAAILGWNHRHYTWRQGRQAGNEARSLQGPVVLIWHSAGKKASDDFCKAFGRSVRMGFAIDSWLPGQAPHKLIRQVYSIKAGRGGRFHVQGHTVIAQILYPDENHTSIDDEPVLHDFIIDKMEALMNAPVQIKPFYIGEGTRLGEGDFPLIAAENNMPEYLLRAVVEIEAAGKGSHSTGALVARYEPHIAWEYAGASRDYLASKDLAYAIWKQGYPKGSPYPLIDQCAAIAGQELAALATSWGIGQVMGFNHLAAGFGSAVDMVREFAASEANQLRGVINFIRATNLFNALLREDWQTFAEGYNGAGHEQHNYAGRLKSAAKRWKAILGSQPPPAPPKPPAGPVQGDPDGVAGVPTLEQLRTATSPDLRQAIRAASDMITLSTIVLDERDTAVAEKPVAATTAAINYEAAKQDEENIMQNTKGFFQSGTIQGLIAVLFGTFLPAIAPSIGLDFPPEAGGEVVTGLSQALVVLGSIFAMIRRATATKKITRL